VNDDCAICLMAFGEDDDVTPLPCDIRHYFHTACIEDWFKQNTTCPLCKKVITKESLEEFEKEFEKKCKDMERIDEFDPEGKDN
jgi:hypothetical protein